MTRYLIAFALGLALFTAGCEEQDGANSTTPQQQTAQQSGAAPTEKPATAEKPALPSGVERITVTLTLPPSSEKIATEALSGHGESCPQSRVSGLLGVEITSPHGVVVGKVLPEGLAAKAGIKPGDSIIMADGSQVTCPRTFEPFLTRGKETREVKLTIVRKKAAAGAATEKPTADKPK